MKIFKCDENITSYKIPILKIISCSFLIALLLIGRIYFFRIDNLFVDSIVGIACALIIILCVLCIYISSGEMLLLHERRVYSTADIKKLISKSKNYPIAIVLSLLEENDIIEFSIVWENQIVTFGVASDSQNGSSRFFDKTYYFNNFNDCIPIEEFKDKLNSYSLNGELCVIAIDGMPPNDLSKS